MPMAHRFQQITGLTFAGFLLLSLTGWTPSSGDGAANAPPPSLLPLGSPCNMPSDCASGLCQTGFCCSTTCGGFFCAPGCLCFGNGTCQNNVCVADNWPLGHPCSDGGQCASHYCVDSVCCDTFCAGGPCTACSVAKGAVADGTCTNIVTCVALDVALAAELGVDADAMIKAPEGLRRLLADRDGVSLLELTAESDGGRWDARPARAAAHRFALEVFVRRCGGTLGAHIAPFGAGAVDAPVSGDEVAGVRGLATGAGGEERDALPTGAQAILAVEE